ERARVEALPQALARARQPFVDRASRAAERSADLVGREAGEVAQLDALAMRSGQREHRRAYFVPDVVALVAERLGPTRDALALLPPRLAARQGARRADPARGEPAAARLDVTRRGRGLDQLHEDLLNGVLGEARIARDVPRDREQPGMLAAHE